MSSAMVIIPARLRSTRLPRKVLLDIGGQSMLQRSHGVALRAACGPVLVLTDDEEVAAHVRDFGGDVRMTDPALESGTARIASVADELDTEVVVNLQADAPLTDPAVIADAAAHALRGDATVFLAVYRLTRSEDVFDPNVVKVVRGRGGRVVYCSRSAVPHVRDAVSARWTERGAHWGHVGIYAYKVAFLRGFDILPPSALEDAERLEQLRWIEAGIDVGCFEVANQGPSVDTPEQLETVRSVIAGSSP